MILKRRGKCLLFVVLTKLKNNEIELKIEKRKKIRHC